MSLKWRTISRGLLSLGWACFLVGCRSARLDELPGKYRANADWGVSTLTLRSDRTMEQDIKLHGGESKKVSGSWESEKGLVWIKPCWAFLRNSGPRQADGCGYAAEVIGFGKADLWIHSDDGFAYQKFEE